MAAGANKVVAAKAVEARARVSSGVAVMAAIRVRIPERYQNRVKYLVICSFTRPDYTAVCEPPSCQWLTGRVQLP
jgi:hypothetical protein